MTKLFVPIRTLEKNEVLSSFKLYEISSSVHNTTLFNGSPYPRQKMKLRTMFPSDVKGFDFQIVEESTKTYFEDFNGDVDSSNIDSISLGLYCSALISAENKVLCQDYDAIVISGDYNEDKKLKNVVLIKEKYESVQKFVRQNSNKKLLFIYISDKEIELKKSDAVTIRRFNSEETLEDIIDYLFDSIIYVQYDPIASKYEFLDENILNKKICKQLENPDDLKSFKVNLKLDQDKFSKGLCPEISIIHGQLKKKEEVLQTCLQLIFSKEFKENLGSICFLDYQQAIESIFDLFLGPERAKDYEPCDFVYNLKNNKQLIVVIHLSKENLECITNSSNCSFFGQQIRSPIGLPLLEFGLALKKEWISLCEVPSLVLKLAELICEGDLKFDDVRESVFDTSKWKFAGPH